MPDQWYYWSDVEVLGPFSGRLLASMAAVGKILPTDIVWREGTEQGIAAGQVKHLFPLVPPNTLPSAEAPSPAVPSTAEATVATVQADAPADGNSAAASTADVPLPSSWFSGAATVKTTRRAVAGKGALIVGQDGTTVKYRMKCTTCGHEDSSYRSTAITRGTKRVSFFCPKCRKSCAVEILGYVT